MPARPFALLPLAALAPLVAVVAQPPKAPAGKVRAVLIAVREQDDPAVKPLRYTPNDAARLKQVLVERGGADPSDILELTDAAPPDRRPTLANLRREVPKFLRAAGPADTVIVFFGGHGLLKNGQAYLVPKDFDTLDMAATALPAADLKAALRACPAKVKLLVADACHAGGGAGGEAVAAALGVADATGVVFLGGCKAAEQGLEWKEIEHGVFTYWLARGLGGAADGNADGVVTADELYDFTHARVSRTAKVHAGRSQTPVRAISTDVSGVTPVLKLRPQTPDAVCRELAEDLHVEMMDDRKAAEVGRRAGPGSVGVVPEFLVATGPDDRLGRATLPGFCARAVRDRLAVLAGAAYRVAGPDALRAAAGALPTPASAATPTGAGAVGKSGGVDVVVTGLLRRRGAGVTVQCEMVRAGELLASPARVLPLTEDLLGDSGFSFDNRKRPEGGPGDLPVLTHAARASQQHPLAARDFPFKLEVVAVGELRGGKVDRLPKPRVKELVADGREMAVGVRDGEVIAVRVTNGFADTVGMSLLVDGINTIDQGRELIGRGPMWVLKPRPEPYVVNGWSFPGKREVRPFVLTDVGKSVAGRQTFKESLGLITAAFYAPFGKGLAVGEGPAERREFRAAEFQAGRLLGVINLRYVDEKGLN